MKMNSKLMFATLACSILTGGLARAEEAAKPEVKKTVIVKKIVTGSDKEAPPLPAKEQALIQALEEGRISVEDFMAQAKDNGNVKVVKATTTSKTEIPANGRPAEDPFAAADRAAQVVRQLADQGITDPAVTEAVAKGLKEAQPEIDAAVAKAVGEAKAAK